MADADREHWSRVAAEWIAWARKPNHDAFWAYREALAAFVGDGTGEALDVGCGEGRVSRLLKSRGYRVTAADPVEPLLRAAEEAGSADKYVLAGATELPFPDDSFALVMAYNVLMDVEDVPAALRELARVLHPSGVLILSIVHPMADHGRFDGPAPDAPFVIRGRYFGRRRFAGTEERDGLSMRFAGWSQPLEGYVAALEAAGLAITSIREPLPDVGAGREHMRQWRRIPLFLWMKLRRFPG